MHKMIKSNTPGTERVGQKGERGEEKGEEERVGRRIAGGGKSL
jgi:hypothetical protein